MTQLPKQNCKWEENLLEHDFLLLFSPIFLKKYKETHLFTQFSRLKQKKKILFSLSFQNLSKKEKELCFLSKLCIMSYLPKQRIKRLKIHASLFKPKNKNLFSLFHKDT